jgi:hypothetical protein
LNTYGYVGGNPIKRIDASGTTWGSNIEFLWEWWWELGSANREYGPNDFRTKELSGSAAAAYLREEYIKNGCKDITIKGYGTLRGFWDTGMRPWEWGSTATQIGGFVWSAINIGNGKVRFRVYNTASLYSLFYHLPGMPHKERGSSWFPFGGNIQQKFEWTESISCDCGK